MRMQLTVNFTGGMRQQSESLAKPCVKNPVGSCNNCCHEVYLKKTKKKLLLTTSDTNKASGVEFSLVCLVDDNRGMGLSKYGDMGKT